MTPKMTPAEVQKLLSSVQNMTESQLRDLYATIEEHEILAEREYARKNFMGFVKKVWPNFIEGAHHKRMAAAFERVARGECKRRSEEHTSELQSH